MATESAITRLLYVILSQKCLKDIDWHKVARDQLLCQEVTNGHAARMRYSRFKKQMDAASGIVPPPRKLRKSKNNTRVEKNRTPKKEANGRREHVKHEGQTATAMSIDGNPGMLTSMGMDDIRREHSTLQQSEMNMGMRMDMGMESIVKRERKPSFAILQQQQQHQLQDISIAGSTPRMCIEQSPPPARRGAPAESNVNEMDEMMPLTYFGPHPPTLSCYDHEPAMYSEPLMKCGTAYGNGFAEGYGMDCDLAGGAGPYEGFWAGDQSPRGGGPNPVLSRLGLGMGMGMGMGARSGVVKKEERWEEGYRLV